MPLYTFIANYKGVSYSAQARRSNFKGFPAIWTDSQLTKLLPGWNSSLQNELADKAYRTQFSPVPNREKVWVCHLDVGGERFTTFAIQNSR